MMALAAEQKYTPAREGLGIFYTDGPGVPQAPAAAAERYRKAAEQGCADTRAMPGGMYFADKGVARDHAAVVVRYRNAAEHKPMPIRSQLNRSTG